MKFRAWLLLLLFTHVLLHPWVHSIGLCRDSGSTTSVSAASSAPVTTLVGGEQCELCRVGSTAAVGVQLPIADLLTAHWISTALQSINCTSLQADRSLPSRAPPAL